MNNPLIPETFENINYNVYQYSYFLKFDDKIYHTKANLDLTNQLLKKWNIIRKNKIPDDNELGELVGDLKEEYFFHSNMNIPIGYIERFIKTHLENIHERKISNISFCKRGSEKPCGLWVNYQTKNEYNPHHDHDGMYSFVWYLDVPEEIRNECYVQKSNSKTRGIISFNSKMSNESLHFNPKTADVFIFKSDHMHQVYPFYSNNIRVSMAGNVHSITFEDGETITA